MKALIQRLAINNSDQQPGNAKYQRVVRDMLEVQRSREVENDQSEEKMRNIKVRRIFKK